MSVCIAIPKLPFPTLPTKLSFQPVLPSFKLTIPNPCCLLPFPIEIDISLPLPPLTVKLAFLAPIQAAMDTLEALINEIPLNCPWASATNDSSDTAEAA